MNLLHWSIDSSSSTEDLWRAAWETDPPANSEIINDPTVPVPGANLPRREWCILNHFRSGAGRCAASLHQWGYTDNPLCVCGATQTSCTSLTAARYTTLKAVLLPSTEHLIPQWSGCVTAAYAKERKAVCSGLWAPHVGYNNCLLYTSPSPRD